MFFFLVCPILILHIPKTNRAEASARQYRDRAQVKITSDRTVKKLKTKVKNLENKDESVQQFRHETNRTLDTLKNVYGELSILKKENEELSGRVDTANQR